MKFLGTTSRIYNMGECVCRLRSTDLVVEEGGGDYGFTTLFTAVNMPPTATEPATTAVTPSSATSTASII